MMVIISIKNVNVVEELVGADPSSAGIRPTLLTASSATTTSPCTLGFIVLIRPGSGLSASFGFRASSSSCAGGCWCCCRRRFIVRPSRGVVRSTGWLRPTRRTACLTFRWHFQCVAWSSSKASALSEMVEEEERELKSGH